MGVPGDISPTTVYGGGAGYVLLAAMAATSNDASQRALGANWRRLHVAGIYVLWIIFAATILPAVTVSPVSAVLGTGLLAAFALRVWPSR